MKPFYHLANLGIAMDQMLTCNIRRDPLDAFEPADKLSLAFTIDEVAAMDVTAEIFQATYVRDSLRQMVTQCNKLENISVCALPSYEKKNGDVQVTFKYEDLPLRYTVERMDIDIKGESWRGFYIVFDVLVKGL
jgi:hypothetical protein